MNYLQLCQRMALECGVSGTITTTAGQVGSLNRIVTWVGQAWTEVQTDHDDWEWMRSSNILGLGASFQTVSGTTSYPLGTGLGTCGILPEVFGKWDRESFRSFTTSVGTNNEIYLDEIPYDVWRDGYMYGAMREVRTRPVAIAIGPDKSLCLGPPPNSDYTVTGDYYIAPTSMAVDADIPIGLPARWHMLIVYKAMMYYGAYESAPEVYQRGSDGYTTLLAQLETTYAPRLTFCGALA